MMSERQRKFREEYQAQIHPLYSGQVHVGVMYAVGLSAIAFCISRMQDATWEWLLVVPVFAVSNLFEWWIHKYVMHRLVDVSAILGVVHYLWLVKIDTRRPIIYGAIVAALLALRIYWARTRTHASSLTNLRAEP